MKLLNWLAWRSGSKESSKRCIYPIMTPYSFPSIKVGHLAGYRRSDHDSDHLWRSTEFGLVCHPKRVHYATQPCIFGLPTQLIELKMLNRECCLLLRQLLTRIHNATWVFDNIRADGIAGKFRLLFHYKIHRHNRKVEVEQYRIYWIPEKFD